jgi:glycerophosphoryl diester phosphodiesterase
MKIFAHRGIFDYYPENSYEALDDALSQGFSIETDLRLTLDGDFVIIHDDSLGRVCDKDIPVNSLTLAKLEQHCYVDNEGQVTSHRLSSFRRYCELLVNTSSGLETALHLKADSQAEEGLCKISDYFREYDLYRKAFVLGLTLQAVAIMRKVDPKIRIALMISERKFESTIYLWNEV